MNLKELAVTLHRVETTLLPSYKVISVIVSEEEPHTAYVSVNTGDDFITVAVTVSEEDRTINTKGMSKEEYETCLFMSESEHEWHLKIKHELPKLQEEFDAGIYPTTAEEWVNRVGCEPELAQLLTDFKATLDQFGEDLEGAERKEEWTEEEIALGQPEEAE